MTSDQLLVTSDYSAMTWKQLVCMRQRLIRATKQEMAVEIADIVVVIGGAITSCAGIRAAFVCTSSSKQVYPVSIPSDFAGEVSNHLGLSPDSFSMSSIFILAV